MATDRIGIRHRTGEVEDAMMSFATKRKVEELGGHVLSAAVGDVVARTMSVVVGRYEAQASVDDQLERLRTLLVMLHSAVEVAEGVHIRSWWLRRWLWKLRDAALDADEVLQLFRQRRAAEETTEAANSQAAGNTVWSAAWRAVQSVKGLLFGRNGDHYSGNERLSRMVARLEREAMGLGDFLKVLELEIRRSLPVPPEPVLPPPVPPARPSPSATVPPASVRADTGDYHWHSVNNLFTPMPMCMHWIPADKNSASPDCRDQSRFDHGLSSISHEEYIAGMRKMGLLIVRQRIRRALDWLMISRKPAAAPPPASRAPALDTDRIREVVDRIQRDARGTSGGATMDFHRKRSWLGTWSCQLLAVASIAEYHLLAVSAQAGGDGDAADVTEGHGASAMDAWRRAAQNMETAAAHLEDFFTLTGFALASGLGRPCADS